MFERFKETENEDDGNRKFLVLICENKCEMVHCVHFSRYRSSICVPHYVQSDFGGVIFTSFPRATLCLSHVLQGGTGYILRHCT
jgi:hypothetical protein